MQLLLKLKNTNDKYKRNRPAYIIGIVGLLGTLTMIVFAILHLSGFFDETTSRIERLMLPDPLEQAQKTKRQLQSDIREDRIVSNREMGATLDATYRDTLVSPNSKTIAVGHNTNKDSLYAELGGLENTNKENAKKIADNILDISNERDDRLQTLAKEQQKNDTIENLKEQLAQTQLEKKIIENRLKTHETINGLGTKNGYSDSSGNGNTNNYDALQGQSSSNMAVGGSQLTGNGATKTLSNGHIITENGTISEVYTVQAGQGYITSTAKPQNVATTRNTTPAIVDRDHTLYAGSLLQIRLLKDVNLSGVVVPLNYYVYGIVRFAKERIYIDFKTIEFNNSIIDFKAVVYDYDGLLGLDAPGTVSSDIAKNAGAQAIEGTNASASNSTESILGNATAAVTNSAVNAVKSLSSIKILEQKVNIKAGHKLFLVF